MGTAYILAQRKDESKGYNIISVDSTTFKNAQIQYSPFKAEALGIDWFLTKEDYFTGGAQNITIYNDAKNMGTFMQSDMNNIKNPRLFKMLEKTMMYSFEVK